MACCGSSLPRPSSALRQSPPRTPSPSGPMMGTESEWWRGDSALEGKTTTGALVIYPDNFEMGSSVEKLIEIFSVFLLLSICLVRCFSLFHAPSRACVLDVRRVGGRRRNIAITSFFGVLSAMDMQCGWERSLLISLSCSLCVFVFSCARTFGIFRRQPNCIDMGSQGGWCLPCSQFALFVPGGSFVKWAPRVGAATSLKAADEN